MSEVPLYSSAECGLLDCHQMDELLPNLRTKKPETTASLWNTSKSLALRYTLRSSIAQRDARPFATLPWPPLITEFIKEDSPFWPPLDTEFIKKDSPQGGGEPAARPPRFPRCGRVLRSDGPEHPARTRVPRSQETTPPPRTLGPP